MRVDEQLTGGLKEIGRREGATLFMVLLAAFQTLLSRYAGQQDITVGIPVANRTPGELEPLIGFFVNTLAVRLDLSGEPKFKELVARTKEAALARMPTSTCRSRWWWGRWSRSAA